MGLAEPGVAGSKTVNQGHQCVCEICECPLNQFQRGRQASSEVTQHNCVTSLKAKVADSATEIMQLRSERNRNMKDFNMVQEENMGLRAELNVLRDRETDFQDRERDRTTIEQELIQEMQIQKKDSVSQEL